MQMLFDELTGAGDAATVSPWGGGGGELIPDELPSPPGRVAQVQQGCAFLERQKHITSPPHHLT